MQDEVLKTLQQAKSRVTTKATLNEYAQGKFNETQLSMQPIGSERTDGECKE
jgi:polysaccharide deacetylase 2 family uncharacterized protein YibQ